MIEKPILAPAPRRTVAKRKSGNQVVNNSTTLVDATGLSFPIGANETWVASFTLPMTFAAAGQAKVAVTAPSGATGSVDAELVSSGLVPIRGITATFGTGIGLDSTTGVAGVVIVRVTVVNGATAGNVQLQFAQNAASLTDTTLLTNASLVALEV